jgi:hypothetical protein
MSHWNNIWQNLNGAIFFYPLKVMLYVPLEQHMAKPERCYIVLYFFR